MFRCFTLLFSVCLFCNSLVWSLRTTFNFVVSISWRFVSIVHPMNCRFAYSLLFCLKSAFLIFSYNVLQIYNKIQLERDVALCMNFQLFYIIIESRINSNVWAKKMTNYREQYHFERVWHLYIIRNIVPFR